MKTLWTNARLATLDPALPGLGALEGGALAVEEGRIRWVGPVGEVPAAFSGAERIDLEGRWVTPGLIDCHTHLVHGGDRAREFEMRLEGATYEEIARAGGGILSTVTATRSADHGQLVAGALKRLDALMAEGMTSVEIKSGYGLTVESEIAMLRAARALEGERQISVSTSCLAAHAIPPEFAHDRPGYIRLITEEMLPRMKAQGLADAVDGFCEGIALHPHEIEQVFKAAKALGLPVKLHADQLSDLGGAALTARFGGLSADHLECTNEEGAAAMARAGTVAVLLPGAYYMLRETRLPPIEAFRRHGTHMALATDNNPGTSPLTSLLLTMNMGATLFRMRVSECIAGVTREAARALGRLNETGTLEPGKWADLAIWDIERPAEIVYRLGFNPLLRRVWHGHH
jgi:imidazolonepropionase